MKNLVDGKKKESSNELQVFLDCRMIFWLSSSCPQGAPSMLSAQTTIKISILGLPVMAGPGRGVSDIASR
jgi:hypothetical protein